MLDNFYSNPIDYKMQDNLMDKYKTKEAKDWAEDSIRTIITPTEDLKELEDEWNAYNNMIKKHRRESDWKSLELFGMDNQTHYESLRAKLLQDDIEDDGHLSQIDDGDSPILESYVDAADSYYNSDAIHYTTEDVEKAKAWASEANRTIIIPTRTIEELESLWDSYNLMVKKHRRESDWMSEELFGITNLRHYEHLKAQFMRQDVDKSKDYNIMLEGANARDIKSYVNELCESGDVSSISSVISKMTKPSKSIYEELIVNNIISDAIATCNGISQSIPIITTAGDMPAISANDMIDMGVFSSNPENNYFGELSDNDYIVEDGLSTKEWFELYKLESAGLPSGINSVSHLWVDRVRVLMHELSVLENTNAGTQAINAKKQSILELGWNPSIPFTSRNRTIANECYKNRLANVVSTPKVVDLREFVSDDNLLSNTVMLEASNKSNLKPVFVVMTEGKSKFSDAIRAVTHSIYSHASISFDYTLETMYSYAIAGEKPGFRKENIKNISKASTVGVYVFFVSEPIYDKMVAMIDDIKENINKAGYSYKNLITFLFNIPYNDDYKMLCSQFVDRCLKVAGIDISKRDSSLMSPARLDDSLKNTERVYHVYEGLATKYDANKTKKLINALMGKAKPLKEGLEIMYKDESSFISAISNNSNNISVLLALKEHSDIVKNPLYKKFLEEVLFDTIEIRPFVEAKRAPIRFDDNGNMIIQKDKKLDYESEYAKSHKLLKEYLRYKNIDGMKYETSKLWMMLCMIEDTMRSDKFKELPSVAITSSMEVKAKAKITNDFNFYLKEIMKLDPSFNFTEYYEASPFNSKEMQIDASTITFMANSIKKFLKFI